MKVNLIGLRKLDFENEKGDQVQGIKLFFAYPEENVYGNTADSRFISAELIEKLGVPVQDLIDHIDQVIDIEISPKNKIVGITI